eukprot:c35827_g1_i1.p1 GENE.c35827_g1_i1~~c35827_g1_i1.p1  ORF type:complete len:141 (+),score=23.41 c35827_g1_i1:132-554(+)
MEAQTQEAAASAHEERDDGEELERLEHAVEIDDAETVTALLHLDPNTRCRDDHHARIATIGFPLFFLAVFFGSTRALRVLLDAGADTSATAIFGFRGMYSKDPYDIVRFCSDVRSLNVASNPAAMEQCLALVLAHRESSS